MAGGLIAQFTNVDSTIYDPFSGCGTIAFEAWRAGRHIVANDLSPYASLLTRAKLFPYTSLDRALNDIERLSEEIIAQLNSVDLRKVPKWVRDFFHPETLREVIAWSSVLKKRRRWFLLACLMGILHHQRPGFLSYPSSHTVPYLRAKNFPRSRFPDLYEHRPLEGRLISKVQRAFSRAPALDSAKSRECYARRAEHFLPACKFDAIITSPPYMRQLDYGRDNRLRLWFLGRADWQSLDRVVSPRESEFLVLMQKCFRIWKRALKPNGSCILIVGNSCSREKQNGLPSKIEKIATQDVGGYTLIAKRTETIPNERRVRRGIRGSTKETILVLRRNDSIGRQRKK